MFATLIILSTFLLDFREPYSLTHAERLSSIPDIPKKRKTQKKPR